MKAYKGFNKDLTCRGFQYEEGKTYEEKEAELCESGFHACENPIDCFAYYAPADSEYREVELEDVNSERNSDSKIVAKKITIGAKIDLFKIAQVGVEYIKSKVDWANKNSKTGDRSVASNTGYCSIASNTGDYSVASNTGHCSIASNTGDRSVASNTGHCSIASNTGNCSIASNTGDYSVASNTGHCSVAETSGKESIAIVTGGNSKACGALGDWLVITERDDDWHILGVQAVRVDGEKIKADTWYKLENGKITECE